MFEANIPKSQLPLRGHACHCYSCRHMTGALHTTNLRWPISQFGMDVSKLKAFHFTPLFDLLFCPTCSSPMFFVSTQNKDCCPTVLSGVLTNIALDIIELNNHIFAHNTIDGGASIWLRHNPNGSTINRLKIDKTIDQYEELPEDWPSYGDLSGYDMKQEDSVPIRCKCKGVDLILHRGDYSKFDTDELPYNIDPKTHKLLAGFCGCDSCRLQSGVDVFNWTFAQMDCISFGTSDKPFPTDIADLRKLVDGKEPALGTLTYYTSRKDVQRYFCRICSACIFYAVEHRPKSLDIAVGVLDASDGVRAEGLLSWSYGARISYREDGDGGWREKLFDDVEQEAEEYRVARGYPKNWVRIAKDKNGGRSPE